MGNDELVEHVQVQKKKEWYEDVDKVRKRDPLEICDRPIYVHPDDIVGDAMRDIKEREDNVDTIRPVIDLTDRNNSEVNRIIYSSGLMDYNDIHEVTQMDEDDGYKTQT